MPEIFNKYWKLFKFFGAKSIISLTTCLSVLKYIFETSNENLNDEQFNYVLIILKIIIMYDKIDQNVEFDTLYLPSASKKMTKVNELYYSDTSTDQCLIDKCDQLKNIFLFDINILKKYIEKSMKSVGVIFQELSFDDEPIFEGDFSDLSSGEEIMELNLFKQNILENLSWRQIFETIPYFKNKLDFKPKELLFIIVEKVNEDQSMKKCSDLTDFIHSNKFLDLIIKSIEKSCENSSLNAAEISALKQEIELKLNKFHIYESENLHSFFYNNETSEKIQNSNKKNDFAETKYNASSNQLEYKIYFDKNYPNQWRKDNYLCQKIQENIHPIIPNNLTKSCDVNYLLHLMRMILYKNFKTESRINYYTQEEEIKENLDYNKKSKQEDMGSEKPESSSKPKS